MNDYENPDNWTPEQVGGLIAAVEWRAEPAIKRALTPRRIRERKIGRRANEISEKARRRER